MIFNLTSPVIKSKDHVPVLGEDFTYSGSCTVIDDSNDVEGVQWRIKFLTSGSLVIANDWLVDLFLVGGGRSGSTGNPSYSRIGGNGGAGGQCKTIPSLTVTKGVAYPIVIGGSNGDTSALEQSTSGGGASGGNGGASNSAGGSGSNGTYEFGEAGSDIYGGGGGAGGGGAARSYNSYGPGGNGGNGGGANGGNGGSYNDYGKGTGQGGQSAIANTGGGGGGGGGASASSDYNNYGGSGGAGGSGIVIMRKHKEAAA